MIDTEAVTKFQKKYAGSARQDFQITRKCPLTKHLSPCEDVHGSKRSVNGQTGWNPAKAHEKQVHGHTPLLIMPEPETIAPEKLPDPWLIESEFLMNELERVRELVLKIPIHNDTVLPSNSVIDAIWRLEKQLRFLLHLHKEGQRSFAKKAQTPTKKKAFNLASVPKHAKSL